MEKVILYYRFAPLDDPEAVRYWQRALAASLNLKGRILISKHGINGTLGGDIKNLKAYIKETKSFPAFKGIAFKWSEGGADDFPRLNIKHRDEIVSFGVPDEINVDTNGIVGGGKHLKPKAVHKLIEEKKGDVIFFDGRNAYEAAVGRFKNAVIPDVENTRDFVKELESGKYDEIKDKPVVTYCTGGIRCEVLSVLMKNRGFKEVYQIDGGIVKYGEAYKDEGFWEGSLYVFDKRMNQQFSDRAKTIAKCRECRAKTSNFENCAWANCNKLVLVCENCAQNLYTCSKECADKHSVVAKTA